MPPNVSLISLMVPLDSDQATVNECRLVPADDAGAAWMSYVPFRTLVREPYSGSDSSTLDAFTLR